MDFVSNQEFQNQEMLKAIDTASIEDLFASIPKKLFHSPPKEEDGISEQEAYLLFEKIGKQNSFTGFESYLGAGAYAHYVPSVIGAIISRSEFLTAYTPYQPEVSQGMLQAIFEFQTAYAALTNLDVANASVYDAASACAEAVLMALRICKGKKTVAISRGLNPLYRASVLQYLSGFDVQVVSLEDAQDAACFLVQSPNFFGEIEDMQELAKCAKSQGALFIACGNPLSYGLLSAPGDFGADIAVGDCQPLGLPLNFGGPFAGYMACKEEYVRQLPGRLVGKTVDSEGNPGFVLTLQAREQHIRREKATSNICTNQALSALASLICLIWYGPKGLKQLALTNYQRAHYLASELEKIEGFKVSRPFFNEFTLTLPCLSKQAIKVFRKNKILPGVALNQFFPEMDKHLLVSVTELKTLEMLQKYVEVAKTL